MERMGNVDGKVDGEWKRDSKEKSEKSGRQSVLPVLPVVLKHILIKDVEDQVRGRAGEVEERWTGVWKKGRREMNESRRE